MAWVISYPYEQNPRAKKYRVPLGMASPSAFGRIAFILCDAELPGAPHAGKTAWTKTAERMEGFQHTNRLHASSYHGRIWYWWNKDGANGIIKRAQGYQFVLQGNKPAHQFSNTDRAFRLARKALPGHDLCFIHGDLPSDHQGIHCRDRYFPVSTAGHCHYQPQELPVALATILRHHAEGRSLRCGWQPFTGIRKADRYHRVQSAERWADGSCRKGQ